MAKHATSQLTWYHKPFGRRLISSEQPYFAISDAADPDDGDTRRRNELADLAGL
jgi:hypothetical protein